MSTVAARMIPASAERAARSKRIAFTPKPAYAAYFAELLDSGLWGDSRSDLVNNLLREGLMALKARGVKFECEQKGRANGR